MLCTVCGVHGSGFVAAVDFYFIDYTLFVSQKVDYTSATQSTDCDKNSSTSKHSQHNLLRPLEIFI